MLDWLDGKKTYIIAAIMFVIAGLHAIKSMIPILQDIPDGTWQTIMQFVQGGGLAAALAALRAGVGKGQ